jgi:hypothetical protein
MACQTELLIFTECFDMIKFSIIEECSVQEEKQKI